MSKKQPQALTPRVFIKNWSRIGEYGKETGGLLWKGNPLTSGNKQNLTPEFCIVAATEFSDLRCQMNTL